MPDASIAGFGQTGIPPIGVNPQDWYNLQRRQALAAGLAQNALTPLQAQNYGPIRSRTGLASIGNSLASALLARKLEKQLGPQYADINRQMLAPWGGGAPATAPSPSPDQGASPPPPAMAPPPGAGPAGGAAPSPSPPAGPAPGAGPPPPAPAGASPGLPAAPGGGGTAMNPLNLPPALAMTMFMRDPGKYGELVAGPEAWRTMLMATGGNTQMAAQLTLNKAFKDGLIDVRPGGMIVGKNPDNSPFILRNPQLAAGVEPSFGPGWSVEGAHLIPGYLDAEAAVTGTTKRAEAENTLHELKTRGGGTAYSFGIPGSVPGAPGASGAAGAPPAPTGAAPHASAAPAQPGGLPQFFPSPSSGGAATPPAGPTAPPGVEARGADPWQSIPQLKIPSGYGAPDEYTEKILDKAADKHIELVDKYGTEADSADQRIAFNNEALKLLQGNQVEVGPLSDRLVKLSKMAAEAGISVPWLPSPEVANNTDELKKFLVRNPLTNLKPTFGGRPAAVEFQVLRTEASPSETMLSGASQRLIQIDNTQAQFQKDRAQAYDRYHDQGGNPLRFEQWYSSRFPMSQVLDQPQAGEQPTRQQAAAEIARRAALKRQPASSAP